MSVTVAVAVTTDVQSALHQHAHRLADEYATDSLPGRRTDDVVMQVAPLLYQSLLQVVDATNSCVNWQCRRWQFSTIFL